jgi:hypothetical protein
LDPLDRLVSLVSPEQLALLVLPELLALPDLLAPLV